MGAMAVTWSAQKRVHFTVREAIIRAADFTCSYCGSQSEQRNEQQDWVGPDGLPWHIDHVRPADRDDPTTLEPENLTLACSTCNTLKGARSPIELFDELTRLVAHVSQMQAHSDHWPH